MKAKTEIGSTTVCFDKCVGDVMGSATLSSDEKNCIRECYLKRVASRDDMSILVTQMLVRANLKARKEQFI